MNIRKKYGIIVISIGKRDFSNICIKTMQDYAKKLNADLIIKTSIPILVKVFDWLLIKKSRDIISVYIYKILIIGQYLKHYKRVLLLDDSCIMNADAPNIFDTINGGFIGAYEEGKRSELKSFIKDKKYILRRRKYSISHYYNTGVIVADRKARSIFSLGKVLANIDLFCSAYPDQAYFAFVVNKMGVNIQGIDEEWNYTPHVCYEDTKNRELTKLPAELIKIASTKYIVHVTGYYTYRYSIIKQIYEGMKTNSVA